MCPQTETSGSPSEEKGSAFDRLAREERKLRRRVKNFCAADRLPRDRVYDRRSHDLPMSGGTPFK
jgi:hypothetical protein